MIIKEEIDISLDDNQYLLHIVNPDCVDVTIDLRKLDPHAKVRMEPHHEGWQLCWQNSTDFETFYWVFDTSSRSADFIAQTIANCVKEYQRTLSSEEKS